MVFLPCMLCSMQDLKQHQKKYIKAVSFLAHKKVAVLAGIAGAACLFGILLMTTPASFVPDEDMGTIFVNISLPPASSLERTTIVTDEVGKIAGSYT